MKNVLRYQVDTPSGRWIGFWLVLRMYSGRNMANPFSTLRTNTDTTYPCFSSNVLSVAYFSALNTFTSKLMRMGLSRLCVLFGSKLLNIARSCPSVSIFSTWGRRRMDDCLTLLLSRSFLCVWCFLCDVAVVHSFKASRATIHLECSAFHISSAGRMGLPETREGMFSVDWKGCESRLVGGVVLTCR